MKKIFLFISALVLFGFSAAVSADTTSTLTVSPMAGIFNVTNAAPGGIYRSKVISATNTGSSSQIFQFSIFVKTNPEALAKSLYLRAEDESGNCLWDCDYSKNLGELSAGQEEIRLGTIGPEETREYYFSIKFDEDAGNDLQDSSMSFDIMLGYAGPGESGAAIQSSRHHGDNDKRGGGDNGDRNEKKKDLASNIVEGVRNFFRTETTRAQAKQRQKADRQEEQSASGENRQDQDQGQVEGISTVNEGSGANHNGWWYFLAVLPGIASGVWWWRRKKVTSQAVD